MASGDGSQSARTRGRFGEFCEANNIVSAVMPLSGLPWILDVMSSPNPSLEEARVSYLLPRAVRALTFILYSLDGREIFKQENIPAETGRHSIRWQDPATPAGAYLYKFEGIDEEGKPQTHYGRLMKISAK